MANHTSNEFIGTSGFSQIESGFQESSQHYVHSLQQLVEGIEDSVAPAVRKDLTELKRFFQKIDAMHENIIPAIREDMIQIEGMMAVLDGKFDKLPMPKNSKVDVSVSRSEKSLSEDGIQQKSTSAMHVDANKGHDERVRPLHSAVQLLQMLEK
jgi:hypothetical protein